MKAQGKVIRVCSSGAFPVLRESAIWMSYGLYLREMILQVEGLSGTLRSVEPVIQMPFPEYDTSPYDHTGPQVGSRFCDRQRQAGTSCHEVISFTGPPAPAATPAHRRRSFWPADFGVANTFVCIDTLTISSPLRLCIWGQPPPRIFMPPPGGRQPVANAR